MPRRAAKLAAGRGGDPGPNRGEHGWQDLTRRTLAGLLLAGAAVAAAGAGARAAGRTDPDRGDHPRPGGRPLLVGGQERRRRRRQDPGCRCRLPVARHLRHGADGAADRRRGRQQAGRARGLDPRRRRARSVGQARHRGRHPGDRDRFGRGQADPRAGRPALSRAVRVRGRRRRRRARGQARHQEGGLPQPGGRQHQPGRPLRRLRQGPGRRGPGGGRHDGPHRDEGPRLPPICAPIPTPSSCSAAASPRPSRRWPRSRSSSWAARSRSAPSTCRRACCRRSSTARWSGASTPSNT